jgi:hypothetical protein
LEEDKTLDSAIISSRCATQGLSIKDGDVGDFIDNLLLSPLNLPTTVQAAKELIMLRLRRNKINNARDIAKFAQDFEGVNIEDFQSGTEKIFADGFNCISMGNEEFVDLHKRAYELTEEAGTEGPKFIIKTPWPTFNKAYGGIRPKDSYCLAGRPGDGKSGNMLYLAEYCANRIPENFIDGKPLPVLYLDTEMEADEQALRLAAIIANVPTPLIENGKWRNNKEYVESVRGVLKDTSAMDNFYFKYIPRAGALEVRSIFRKWYKKYVGTGNYGLVVFDYLKLTGDELGKNTQNTSLAVGSKLDVLKDEIKENSNCGFLFGAQRKRGGEEDDASLAESDYIQRLSNYVGLIIEKTESELKDQPMKEFGTHKLITVKARKLAEGGQQFKRPVNINGKWTKNWINLKFNNFRFEDVGDGQAVADHMSLTSSNKRSDNKSKIP